MLTPEGTSEVLEMLEVMEEALGGDGSTDYMPDVRPSEAVRWILTTLHEKGYAIVKVKG